MYRGALYLVGVGTGWLGSADSVRIRGMLHCNPADRDNETFRMRRPACDATHHMDLKRPMDGIDSIFNLSFLILASK